MISKTIGFRGTLFSDTPISVATDRSNSKLWVLHGSGINRPHFQSRKSRPIRPCLQVSHWLQHPRHREFNSRFWRGQTALEGTPFCHGNIIHVYFIRFLLVMFVGREVRLPECTHKHGTILGILRRLKLWPKPFVHRCAKTKSALVASICKPINELINLG